MENDFPVKYAELTKDEHVRRAKRIVVNNRVYEIYVQGPKDSVVSEDPSTFLDSFILNPEPENLLPQGSGKEPDKGPKSKDFEDKAGKFKIMFPGTPRKDDKDGLFSFTSNNKGGTFKVEYKDDKNGDKGLEALVKDMKAEETTKTANPPQLNGKYPGREFEYAGAKERVRMRVYFVNDRVYTLTVAGDAAFLKSAETATFFGSFALLP